MKGIFERAARYGIEAQYHDGLGQLRTVEPETLAQLVGALASRANPARAFPPSVILRGAHRSISFDHAPQSPFTWEIWSRERIAWGKTTGRTIDLPCELPHGIYRLRIGADTPAAPMEDACLIASPERA